MQVKDVNTSSSYSVDCKSRSQMRSIETSHTIRYVIFEILLIIYTMCINNLHVDKISIQQSEFPRVLHYDLKLCDITFVAPYGALQRSGPEVDQMDKP